MNHKDSEGYRRLEEQLRVLLVDESAVKYCCDFWLQAQLLDDVVDGDEVPFDSAHKLVQLVMGDLKFNPFYQRFQSYLAPVELSFYLQWVASDRLERSKKDLHKAFMLRAAIFQIFHLCAALLHGVEYAVENSVIFQDLYGETFEEYSEEFK